MRSAIGCCLAVCLLPGAVVSTCAAVSASAATSARADDYRIYPGSGIGRTFIGMSRAAVHSLLKKPKAVHRRTGGLTEEVWWTLTTGSRLIVLYRHDRVVQIETTSAQFHTANGSSRTTALKVERRRFGEFRITAYQYPSSHGYFKSCYFDSVANGIAFVLDVRGQVDADTGFDSVIVHRPGHRVIPHAGGARVPPPIPR